MIICLDVETTKFPKGLPWVDGSYLVTIHMARSDGVVKSWVFNHTEKSSNQREVIEDVQSEINNAKRIVAHNLKFDLHWLRHVGLDLSGVLLYCTLVGEYILRGFQRMDGLSLDELCEYYKLPKKIDKVKSYWDSDYETDEIPLSILLPYGEQDCISTMEVYNKQIPQIISSEKTAYISLEMEALRDIQEAEYNGMLLDIAQITELHEDAETRIAEMDAKLVALINEPELNINSPQQLSVALYGGTYEVDDVEEVEKGRKDGSIRKYTRKCKRRITTEGLGIVPLKGTEAQAEGIFKTDAPTIMQLKAKSKRAKEFLATYKERAKLSTLNKTFFKGLLDRATPLHRVHPSINQTVTKTSRLSSSNPNGQNIPRGNTGPVKKGFISRYA